MARQLSNAPTARKSAFKLNINIGKRQAEQFDIAIGEKLIGEGRIETPIEEIHAEYLAPRVAYDDLSAEQQAAIQGIIKHQYSCIIGQAGTGKTMVTFGHAITHIVKHYLDQGIHAEIYVVSFTGRAVQQAKRNIAPHFYNRCLTIHKWLGYHPEFVERENEEKPGEFKMVRVFIPEFNRHNKRHATVIFVEEAGMCSVFLWNQLFAAAPNTCKFVMIGDINQLQPVNGRSILGYALSAWPTYQLTEIFRQARENPIIANADRILHGNMPQIDKSKFAMYQLDSDPIKAQGQLLNVVKKLSSQGKFDPIKDAFIVAQNNGMFGQQILNDYLVEWFNPHAQRIIINAGMFQKVFAIGDKVMNLRNDNDRQLTNGMCGIITVIERNAAYEELKRPLAQADTAAMQVDDVDLDGLHDELDAIEPAPLEEDETISQRQASHIVWIKFEDLDEELEFYTASQLGNLTLAYAFTCHKSQGGEHPMAIILCYQSGNENRFATPREWLYTAVTRAKDRVLLCYNNRGLINTLSRQAIKGRTLEEKAQYYRDMQQPDKLVPDLPVIYDKEKVA